jgi:hypothetical protein
MPVRSWRRHAGAFVVVFGVGTVAAPLRADESLPPWGERADIPLPPDARSVVSARVEGAIFTEPGRTDLRRGTAQPGARLPLFASRRAAGCSGRWLNVGPLAWMCSDAVDYSADEPASPALGTLPWLNHPADGALAIDYVRAPRPGAGTTLPPIEPTSPSDDGLPYRYYFAGRDGAFGFANLATALDDAPDQELEPGFAVSILEERSAHGERWGRTQKGRWVAMRELGPARPNLFHGELVAGAALAFGWVVSDKANVYASDKLDKPTSARVRFEKVRVHEEMTAKKETLVRVSADGEPAAWMRARDLAIPRVVQPPPEVALDSERWIDVDLASQTLVAYVGKEPVFATIVSTGKGPPSSEFATHTGTFRIWAKLFTTKMDNLDNEEAERHYAIEDVPWVQFFDKAIALHGAFWHRDFGRIHSHGCVNMAPIDARWVFAFTTPHLPVGWNAVLPAKIDPGAVVRVR